MEKPKQKQTNKYNSSEHHRSKPRRKKKQNKRLHRNQGIKKETRFGTQKKKRTEIKSMTVVIDKQNRT